MTWRPHPSVDETERRADDRIARIVALGASNLTRGFQTVVSTARRAWGPEVEVLGALGHGRSYGAMSRFAMRTRPGILESELWTDLSRLPPAATRGLVTDVGNDLLAVLQVGQQSPDQKRMMGEEMTGECVA